MEKLLLCKLGSLHFFDRHRRRDCAAAPIVQRMLQVGVLGRGLRFVEEAQLGVLYRAPGPDRAPHHRGSERLVHDVAGFETTPRLLTRLHLDFEVLLRNVAHDDGRVVTRHLIAVLLAVLGCVRVDGRGRVLKLGVTRSSSQVRRCLRHTMDVLAGEQLMVRGGAATRLDGHARLGCHVKATRSGHVLVEGLRRVQTLRVALECLQLWLGQHLVSWKIAFSDKLRCSPLVLLTLQTLRSIDALHQLYLTVVRRCEGDPGRLAVDVEHLFLDAVHLLLDVRETVVVVLTAAVFADGLKNVLCGLLTPI